MGRGDGQKDRQAGAGGRGLLSLLSPLFVLPGVSCLSRGPAGRVNHLEVLDLRLVQVSLLELGKPGEEKGGGGGGGAKRRTDSKNVVSVCCVGCRTQAARA